MCALRIRKAVKKDVDKVAELIYTTEEDPYLLWGGRNRKECISHIKGLIMSEGSRYSLSYISVAEYNESVEGMIILIPYEEFNKLSINTDKVVFKETKGIKNKIRFIIDELRYTFVKECRSGEIYIANIATSEWVHGLGVGKRLMYYAEEQCRRQNKRRCSLIAKDDVVEKFYEKINYCKIMDKPVLGHRIIRMVKTI